MTETLTDRFRNIFSQRRAAREDARAREEEILTAIEHVVDEINPKLRAIGSYRKRLRAPVEQTLAYIAEIAASVPGPVEVNKTTWNRDPMVRAFFTNVGDMREVLGCNKEIQAFFKGCEATGQQYCFAMLSMLRSERTVTGVESSGDMVKRDVLQTSVSFRDHRVVKPAHSEAQLREELEMRAFEVLVAYVLERITELITAKHSLREQQLLLDMQHRLAQVKKASLSPLLEERDDGAGKDEALQQRQQHMAQEAGEASAKLTTLDDYFDRISDVLGNPAAYLTTRQIHMRLSRMNIKRDENSAEEGNDLQLTEALLGDQLRRILLTIKFSRDEIAGG